MQASSNPSNPVVLGTDGLGAVPVSGSSVQSWYINQVGQNIEIYQIIGGNKYSLSFTSSDPT
jgi:hypothetical protein